MREHICFFSVFVLTALVICTSAEPEQEHEGKKDLLLQLRCEQHSVSVTNSRGSDLP